VQRLPQLGAALVLAFIAGGLPAPAQKSPARGVQVTAFGGWGEALALDAKDVPVRAVIVPAAGGRVVFYGWGGENLLWENPAAAGQTLATLPEGVPPGGGMADIGGELAGLVARPKLTAGPYDWSAPRAFQLRLRGEADDRVAVELEKDVILDPATGELGFVHRLKNTGDRQAARSFWPRIHLRPGGFVLLPAHASSRFPARWSLRREAGGRVAYDGRTPAAEGVRLMDGVLVAKTGGAPAKVGTDGELQWAAYVLGRHLFVVHFPVFGTGVYADGGNTAEAAWNAEFTTLEPLSPEVQLRERKSYEFPTKWMIVELPAEVTTHEAARAAVEQVPSSPFL
jgi:hypothetical protein